MAINAHPELPEFDYIKPDTLADASQFLASHSQSARPLLGGTDIFVRMRDGIWKDKYLVDVKGLVGMSNISFDPSKGLSIGAAVNMNQVIASDDIRDNYPLLVEAAESVASYQLRTRATIVGNICNASPSGDTIGACLLLDGKLTVHGSDGFRNQPLRSFFKAPGETVLNAGDIVTAIHFPPSPEGSQGTYIKLGRNRASDLALVGVTVLGYPDAHSRSGYHMKLALAAVAPTPLVVDEVEKFLSEKPIDEQGLDLAAQIAMDACAPIDDIRASGRYRRLMVRNLSLQALTLVWEKLIDQDE